MASQFGLNPFVDSSLGPNRLGVGFRASHLARPDDLAYDADKKAPGAGYMNAGKLFFAGGTETKDNGLGLTLNLSLDADTGDDTKYWETGNVTVLVGVRKASFTYADALRVGWAIRAGAGVQTFSKDDLLSTNRRAATAPFDVAGFAVDRPIMVSLEARAELRGCYAPYAMLRADMLLWRAQVNDLSRRDQEAVGMWPISLSVGAFMTPWFAFATTLLTANGQDVFPTSVTRIEAMFHLEATRTLSLEAYVAGVSGSVNGAQLGGRVGLQW